MSLKKCISAIAAFLLVACGGDSNASGPSDSGSSESDLVASTFDELPVCTTKREGVTAYIKNKKMAYVCLDGYWTPDEDSSNVILSGNSHEGLSSSSELSNSSQSVELSSSRETVLTETKSSSSSDFSNLNIIYETLIDSRDGQAYKTVKIGNQEWMAENLNYMVDSSFCYKDSAVYCEKYGRLYRWAAAVGMSENECGYGRTCSLPSENIQGVCPEGWHLPLKVEWETLFTAVGGRKVAAKALKSILDWYNYGDGTDDFGFSAYPAGRREINGGYESVNLNAIFWSSSEYDGYYVYRVFLGYLNNAANLEYDTKNNGFSVRCLRDDEVSINFSSSSANSSSSSNPFHVQPCKTDSTDTCKYGVFTDERDGQIYKTVSIGSQIWMAENLNYVTSSSYCDERDTNNCSKFGRLYTYNAAFGACPEDWRLPTKDEWDTLFYSVGGVSVAGKMLKSKDGWNGEGNGLDAYSFSVLPAGFMNNYPDHFLYEGAGAYFWSSTRSAAGAYGAFLSYLSDEVSLRSEKPEYAFSVRCLQKKFSEKNVKGD
jgi:uncharacterized protein (TIGR02145 family)